MSAWKTNIQSMLKIFLECPIERTNPEMSEISKVFFNFSSFFNEAMQLG